VRPTEQRYCGFISMEWMGLNELREKYLSFFETKEHLRLPSFSLIPKDDNSLLLINAGMAPLKKYFTGEKTPPSLRVTTCQKCIRTPDIERVGKTSRHGTYFEMLGNFSFGDYFKREATAWAWEFITKVVGMPEDRLWVSIYLEDDEAFDIWTKEVGVSPDRIVRLGKEDNFWEHGSGPCGPCSEIYFDRGEEHGCGSPDCKVGCDCDRYVEFWNLVFTQFNNDGEGNYTRLEKSNIDTGMGLERLACIMQGVDNLFEVDTVKNIMGRVSEISGVKYKENEKTDVSLRVITDHIRSSVFMISDGVAPQNEGRGYVLRRLLRRAARHGRLIGVTEPFLYKVCDTVIKENETGYPEIKENAKYIRKNIKVEEERFGKTINQGMELLMKTIDALEGDILSGDDAFRLYDTFGFPIDLTREITEEKGIKVDEDRFNELMKEQRVRAREARAAAGNLAWASGAAVYSGDKTEFTGYDELVSAAKVVAIIKDGELADGISDGEEGAVILNRTPFYAESGGQVGDSGVIKAKNGNFVVTDCKKTGSGAFMHIGKMEGGIIEVGSDVSAEVDKVRRSAIMRNHTAAHLLQHALREVLGDHVRQAGSYVDEYRCRFDFSHFAAMTAEEIEKTEAIVNEMILRAIDVDLREMGIDEAKALGATALFGEKYGDRVRVCNIGGESIELCGGTHVSNVAKLGLFKIVSEASAAAGIRRIEAATGTGTLEIIKELKEIAEKTAENLKVGNINDLPVKSAAVMNEMKAKDKEISRLSSKIAQAQADGIITSSVDIGGIRVAAQSFEGAAGDVLRAIGDGLKDKAPDIAAVLVSVNDGKATVYAACGKKAIEAGADAGKIVRAICTAAGGKGGGKPDGAMGGASDIAALNGAIKNVVELVKDAIGK